MRLGLPAVWRVGEFEDRLGLAVGQHVDAGDEPGEEVFDDRGASVGDGALERGCDVFEVIAGRCGWLAVERGGDLVAASREIVALGGEVIRRGVRRRGRASGYSSPAPPSARAESAFTDARMSPR